MFEVIIFSVNGLFKNHSVFFEKLCLRLIKPLLKLKASSNEKYTKQIKIHKVFSKIKILTLYSFLKSHNEHNDTNITSQFHNKKKRNT